MLLCTLPVPISTLLCPAAPGCGTVQPCHLLWAMAADPRVSYNPLRQDPLDKWTPVTAAEVREPPLVWLLQQCPETLPRPAAVYEQVRG